MLNTRLAFPAGECETGWNKRSLDGTCQNGVVPLRELVTFILLGLFLATPGEILNQIVARHDVHAFQTTLFSYSVLLLIAFFVCRTIVVVLKQRRAALVSSYLLFGSLGLALEWSLLGNAPVLDRLQLITQRGMFTYWGTLVLGPILLNDPEAPRGLRRSFPRL